MLIVQCIAKLIKEIRYLCLLGYKYSHIILLLCILHCRTWLRLKRITSFYLVSIAFNSNNHQQLIAAIVIVWVHHQQQQQQV